MEQLNVDENRQRQNNFVTHEIECSEKKTESENNTFKP